MHFHEYFARSLARAEISQHKFAELVGYRQSNLNKILTGKRAPPLAWVEVWADALGDSADKQVFLELAWIANSPPQIELLIADLRRQLAKKAR